jgi:glutamine---fructose-6-phosphate transaminase (isomerizing)
MCGIVAVMRKAAARRPPTPSELDALIQSSEAAIADVEEAPRSISECLTRARETLLAIDAPLRGTPGLRCLLTHPALRTDLERRTQRLDHRIERLEQRLDSGSVLLLDGSVEEINAKLLDVKDALWAIRMERLAHARAVAEWLDGDESSAAVEAFSSIEIALSALDRLEVRGRDSAGLHLFVTGHGLDLQDPDLARQVDQRTDPLYRHGAVAAPLGHLSLVYKVAREVGELGDNTRRLRSAIRDDELLRRALASEDARVMVLGHTRWASVGLINEANAHPVNQEESRETHAPHVIVALNGDVDNHRDLVAEHGLAIPAGITTDAKVIPSLVARQLVNGASSIEAFRRTVDQLYGSVAVAATTALEPSKLMLALRGSGQTLCVGVAEDMYVIASEPYGVVEITSRYLRMDGDAASGADGSQGQIVVLDASEAGNAEGIRRMTYGGAELPVGRGDFLSTDITTRDIDRGDHRHFLLKEISESPSTLRKTLRGRISEVNGRKIVRLDEHTVPDDLRNRLGSGTVNRILVVGQGTAAVAGEGVAASLRAALKGHPIEIIAEPASELSAFGLDANMSDTLVVAVTQSGTTTDTNRTIDLARARGAAVIAIVNRRNSDITHKADGVLYTSDGRDIEMSVASTKAFYSQIAAGFLLGFALADAIGCADRSREHALLSALSELPEAMEVVLSRRSRIRSLAAEFAPRRRHWAIVGNGDNRIAASEIRIKMSELCYKSIALDVTEDKKHIDLSSEPMTLVCAAGLTGSAASDVAKEIAIFRAHKGVPIVIATEGGDVFAGEGLLEVPPVHNELAYVLSTMVGHLFGYEAAIAIDAQAHPLREARTIVDAAARRASNADEMLLGLGTDLAPHVDAFRGKLWGGLYDSTLMPATAARLASLFSYVDGSIPLDLYDREFRKPGTPDNLVDDLTFVLTVAIDDLTRPIDTIRHQAKTVTVGISRADEELFMVPLVSSVLEAGGERDRLSYLNLRTLAAIDGAVAQVTGFTRYVIDRPAASGELSITTVRQGGSASGIRSRTESDHTLRGTKKVVAEQREVLVARGRGDGRLVVFVPEVASGVTTGMTLLHVILHDRLEAGRMRRVLDGYRRRLSALASAVIETEETFDEELLSRIPVDALLTQPVTVLADMWRRVDAPTDPGSAEHGGQLQRSVSEADAFSRE